MLSFVLIVPLLWMLSTSLKDDSPVYRMPPVWIPTPLRFANYPEVLTFQPFGLYFLDTLGIAVPAAIGTVIPCCIVACGFSWLRWPLRDIMFFICLATMRIPLFLTSRQMG